MAWDCQWCNGRPGGCMLCRALPPKEEPKELSIEEDYPRSAWDISTDYGPREVDKPATSDDNTR